MTLAKCGNFQWPCQCYTDEGRLLGHIYIGIEKIMPHLTKAKVEPALVMHLKHLILSHHGEYEFGSPRRPKTAEALALHYADNIDAKMAQLKGLFEAMPEGETGWSPFQPTLQRYVYKPEGTPKPIEVSQSVASTRKQNSGGSEQCSLLLKV